MCIGVQACVARFLALASTAHSVSREMLLVLSVLLGGLRPFQMSAQQALVPTLVPASVLSRAMAFSLSGVQACVIGGPAIGGLLFASGVHVVYFTAASLFCIGCVMCLLVRYEHQPSPRAPVSAATLLVGVRYILENPMSNSSLPSDVDARSRCRPPLPDRGDFDEVYRQPYDRANRSGTPRTTRAGSVRA